MASGKYGEEPENEDPLSKRVRQLDLQYYLRSPYLAGLVVAILCACIYFLYPVASSKWTSWNPGQLHSGHSMLNNNCAACHAEPFKAVEDKACANCHKVSDHGSTKNTIPFSHNAEHIGLKRCAECHIEHKDPDDFKLADTKLCAECHSNLDAIVSKPSYKSFNSWDNHSEFSVTIDQKRIALSDKANLIDTNPIKLNHALHLKPDLKGPDGKVTLNCKDCHEFSHQRELGNVVTFEKNCRSCHPLSFDDRLPKSVVPHGDPSAVYQFLLGEYSKLFGYKMPNIDDLPNERSLPGKIQDTPVVVDNASPASLEKVLQEARAAEAVLFTKTSCQLCHQVSKSESGNAWASKFEVKKPKIPQRWLAKSSFMHTAHEIVNCQSCHAGTAKSEKTTDVSLPGIDTCRDCHVQKGHKGLVPSDCSTCHVFHSSELLESDRAKDLKDLLAALK